MFRSDVVITRLLVSALTAGLSIPALAQSVPYPMYAPGPIGNGAYVVSDGAIITPAGTQVNLGIRVRAKAVALNPTSNHTAAVLTMGVSAKNGNGAVEIFDTRSGSVLQNYNSASGADSHGSYTGITYTPDGKYLLFSQDSSYVAIASVDATGKLSDFAHISVPVAGTTVSVPLDGNSNRLSTVNCFPSSPPGTAGSAAIPCGDTYSYGTSYPSGIAVSPDSKTAYAVLDVNNTLTRINLTGTPTQDGEIRVGNVPHSVIISADGTTAYVSNEAGRIAKADDFQLYSDGTPVVASYPNGHTATGTVSVVNLSTFAVTGSIPTGLHPTGMAFWGADLLVANAYDDTISVIDTMNNTVSYTISLGLPIRVPGAKTAALGAYPNSIAVDETHNIAYVALYGANAIAVVNLEQGVGNPIIGMIPVAYAPSSVVLDTTDNSLIVANDKGIGSKGPAGENSLGTAHGVTAYNTHQDLGTVSIVPVPSSDNLAAMTAQVYLNNHWDLQENIFAAERGNRHKKAVVIPEKIGDPSLIKHVFLIIRENRTYDQILGDVAKGNGDSSLAVFGAHVTPNAHALVQRFPLLDNFYDPSRQSADGHNWIMQAMAPYHDDIQSPDWVRNYPSNGGDAIANQKSGHLFDTAAAAGISMKIYGEYVEYNTFLTPKGSTAEPQWIDWYNDTQCYENKPDCAYPGTQGEKQLYYYNAVASHSPLPNVINYAVQNYPQFDLNIPDQFRVDVWQQDFAKDVASGTVPQLSMLWISSDHTGGPPTAQAMQADNDLALGRFVDIISHSSVWKDSVIFVEEDDAQDGVDHVDGHRSPGYVISPYAVQDSPTSDSTYYSQVNMTRTIEQILGLRPMNWSDLVATPMRTVFTDDPPKSNFTPWTHVSNVIPLTQGVNETATTFKGSEKVLALRAGWIRKKAEIFAGKYTTPDSEDADTVNHLTWYEATGFVRPYPGEKTVRPATDFNRQAPAKGDNDD